MTSTTPRYQRQETASRRVESPEPVTSPRARRWNTIAAVGVLAAAMLLGYAKIGMPPVIIVGGSGLIGLAIWRRTYLRRPTDPALILPPFLLCVAALEFHMGEEYLTRFGPAMSRLFDISWTERSFLIAFAFVGPTIYSLTALGLYRRVPFAGFLAWFIFIGPGLAELTHFIFPLLRPAVEPSVVGDVAGMPNYWLGATGRYYFSGLYTAVLPMIPGIWAIRRLVFAGGSPPPTRTPTASAWTVA